MDVRKAFAKNLLRVRESRGLSQDELALEVGINRENISNYERGARFPDAVIIARLAQTLNVSTDYLLGLSKRETTENAAMAVQIPLEDEAINFIKGCGSEESVYKLDTLSRFLGHPLTKDFFNWFFQYAQIAMEKAGDDDVAMSQVWYMHKAMTSLKTIAANMYRDMRAESQGEGED